MKGSSRDEERAGRQDTSGRWEDNVLGTVSILPDAIDRSECTFRITSSLEAMVGFGST